MQKPADISEATWARLKGHAIPLEDDLDTVLDRLIAGAHAHQACPGPHPVTVAPPDPPDAHAEPSTPTSPTAEDSPVQADQPAPRTVRQICHVILRYVQNQGGAALETDIHRHIAQDLNPPLNDADLHLHTNREPRWRKNARTARYQLTKARMLEPGPQPYSFQLTPQAREHLRHLESARQDQDNDNTHFRGSFYSTTILDLLIREGGTAKTAKVMRHMEKVLTPLFTPADRAHLDKKGPRWRSKVNDAAHSLRKLGYLTTPTRATWEITPEGRHNLARINY